jgi:hypothetical protein
MAKRERWREIPTELSLEQFQEFVLPHLSAGSRGPDTKLSSHALFNYILKQLYLGCQWKELTPGDPLHRRLARFSQVGGGWLFRYDLRGNGVDA